VKLRPIISGALVALSIAFSFPAEAEHSKKVALIGVLGQSSECVVRAQLGAFQQGLRDLGYFEGQNLTIEYRYAEGKLDRLPGLARELIRLKADVILASSTPAVLAAKNETREIPIVFHTIGDPVANGIVASRARPGGNITGVTLGGAELYGKRLELLKEIISELSRAGILLNPTSTTAQMNLKEALGAAEALKLQIHSLEVEPRGN